MRAAAHALATRGAQPAALQRIGRAAVAALYDELALAPKPGLVTFIDNGSHADMDARTFMRSLFALRHSFPQLVALGAADADFDALQREGIAAEVRMLKATAGINTHRGAIFGLGLLCAAAGRLTARGEPLRAEALRRALLARWGDSLAARAARGAGAEAAHGFPVLFDTTLPALRRGCEPRLARLDALFHTIAVLDDTNLARRGGLAGLQFAQRSARSFIAAGGAARPGGIAHAQRLHREFVARRLSPGGAADVLAAACWLQRVCTPE